MIAIKGPHASLPGLTDPCKRPKFLRTFNTSFPVTVCALLLTLLARPTSSAQDITLTGGSGRLYSASWYNWYPPYQQYSNSHFYDTPIDPLTSASASQSYTSSGFGSSPSVQAAYTLSKTDHSITTSLSSYNDTPALPGGDVYSYSNALLSYDFAVNTPGLLSIEFVRPKGLISWGGSSSAPDYSTYLNLRLSKWENGQWISLYDLPSYYSYVGQQFVGGIFSTEVDSGLFRLYQSVTRGNMDTQLSLTATPVPEPGSLLLLTSVGGMCLLRRRRKLRRCEVTHQVI